MSVLALTPAAALQDTTEPTPTTTELEAQIAEWDAAIEQNPEDVNAYFERGLAKIELGDYSGAVLDFDEAIALDDTSGDYYRERAKAYALMNRNLEDAADDLARALELNPEDVKALNNRGCIKRTYWRPGRCAGRLRTSHRN